MTFNEEIYKKLVEAVEKLPENAVERTKKETTRKGYDTTGYQYQYLVNVLNEIIGVNGWSFTYTIAKEDEGTRQSGQKYWEVTIDMEVTILDAKRMCAGGHISSTYADAKKGAITNALKKTLALFGIGKKAYEGTIDEDYMPIPEAEKPKFSPPTTFSHLKTTTQPPKTKTIQNPLNDLPFN